MPTPPPVVKNSLITLVKSLPERVKKSVDAVSKLMPRQNEAVDSRTEGFSSNTNLSYPNQRMIPGLQHEVDLPVEMIAVEAPKLVWKNVKEYVREHIPKFQLEKPYFYTHMRGEQHGATSVRYDFTSDEAFNVWKTGCDSDWNQGYSTMSFVRTDSDTALFSGRLSTKIVKDGRTRYAGWCGIKSDDRLAFMRRKRNLHWPYFSHLIIKCRGDGRSYKVMLHVQEMLDMAWGDNYSYPLHTHGGPYWQYARIPFSRFFKTCGGRIQDGQEELPRFRINAVGITLMDRIDGDFRLEIGFIGATNDITHTETLAYESYQVPVLFTSGI